MTCPSQLVLSDAVVPTGAFLESNVFFSELPSIVLQRVCGLPTPCHKRHPSFQLTKVAPKSVDRCRSKLSEINNETPVCFLEQSKHDLVSAEAANNDEIDHDETDQTSPSCHITLSQALRDAVKIASNTTDAAQDLQMMIAQAHCAGLQHLQDTAMTVLQLGLQSVTATDQIRTLIVVKSLEVVVNRHSRAALEDAFKKFGGKAASKREEDQKDEEEAEIEPEPDVDERMFFDYLLDAITSLLVDFTEAIPAKHCLGHRFEQLT